MNNYTMDYLVKKSNLVYNPKNIRQFSSNMKPFQRTIERMSHSEIDSMSDITEYPDVFNLRCRSDRDKYNMDFLLFMTSMYDLGRVYRKRLINAAQQATLNNWFVPDISVALENNLFIPDRTTAMRDYISMSYNHNPYYSRGYNNKRPTKMSEL